MIKNIIFDMGNVLMDYNPSLPLTQFCDIDEGRALIEKELFNGPEWIEGDLGTISNEERYLSVAKRLPKQYHEALRNCVYRWQESMKPIKASQDFVHYVKEKGYNIYVLSNASDCFYEYFPKFSPLDYFDGIVVSSDIHIIKPDERIYTYLLQQYHLNAKESLFIDDRAENVEAARKLGIYGAVYKDDFESIKKEFHL